METRKLLFGSLFIGGTLAVIRLLFATSASAKPVTDSISHDVIDAYIKNKCTDSLACLAESVKS